jgi:hypothetical protein
MFERVYELLMSLVTYILGFFGIELGKKSVSFADDTSESAKAVETKEVVAAAATEAEESV